MKIDILGLIILLAVIILVKSMKNVEQFTVKENIENKYNHNICSKVPPFPELSIFANNKTSPDCCKGGGYTSTGGCICLCQEQIDYIKNRGGNRAKCSYI